MKKCTLVIMAAGIGSRFGKSIKQLEPVGPNGEIIMDYSIKDSLEAGFNKIVFIIRKDIEEDFKRIIGNRVSKLCEVEYVFQDINDLPQGFTKPEERKKPWGTGQAVLSCKGVVNEPFAVINADDYYGKKAFIKVFEFLTENNYNTDKFEFCMAGFKLKNTLSENGGVTRGICNVDKNDILKDIKETENVVKTADGAAVIINDNLKEIDSDSLVSMNMWGLTPNFIDYLGEGFKSFLAEKINDLKSEYLLPSIIGDLLKKQRVNVRVLETHDTWYGITYKDDLPFVRNAFKNLHDKGIY